MIHTQHTNTNTNYINITVIRRETVPTSIITTKITKTAIKTTAHKVAFWLWLFIILISYHDQRNNPNLQCYCPFVQAVAPPHPTILEQEGLYGTPEAKRRRLEASRYQTSLIDPDFCHDLSVQECQDFEETNAGYHRRTQLLMQSTGIIQPLVLLIKFTDHINRTLPSKQDLQYLWNADSNAPPSLLLPTGSIAEFFRRNSYDNLIINATVDDWRLTDDTELHYSFNRSGKVRSFARAIYPPLRQLDQEGYDFSPHDLNKDGVIDALVILHSGFPAETGGQDCYTLRRKEQRIWSHAIAQFTNEWFSQDGQYRLGSYMVASALRGTCGGGMARIGVMAHEFAHLWGLPDLYDTKKSDERGRGLGKFDMMSDPFGIDGKQTHPNHMSPWTKIRSGWLEPIEITEDGFYTIEASAISPSVYIIREKFRPNEYLLIENRQQLDWDNMLWNSGLLIYHIDDNLRNNTERGFPGQPGWPGNGKHYRVALASGDRNYDLERGHNSGDATDFWRQGQELLPGLLEYEATDFTKYPNTNSYWKGSIWPTGIRIHDISESSTVMSFRVSGLSPATTSPSIATSDIPSYTPTRTRSISPTLVESLPTPKPTKYPTWLPTASLSDNPSTLPTTPSSVSMTAPSSLLSTTTPSPVLALQQTPFPTFSLVASQPTAEQQLGGATPPTQMPTQFRLLPTIDLSGLATTSSSGTGISCCRYYSYHWGQLISSSVPANFLPLLLALGSFWIIG